ncbi:MAG: hypothetical protein WDZ52_15715 [Pseudohongiellaceae bacterium]
MSKRKAKKNATQGVYAFCLTVGAIVGFGLGPIMGGVLISTLFGLILGGLAGYLINRPGKKRKP